MILAISKQKNFKYKTYKHRECFPCCMMRHKCASITIIKCFEIIFKVCTYDCN